ncbi:hypothetical protein [Pseudoalteromonas denitrificans]|uniref:Uncharacterized protein n=1 Tax=Pseudoalteromonas denitrificans DSM 6059 TaxID=1123010 RepID=A0A1I1GMN5_9GAMM|nr:hypothetical protein [Pseudoalteromonas denitrificans]SFC12771.1 hypothetical protein SAMN02745724_00959 [Pseudoalteromonas denitrificans DSM 6059]
MSVAQDLAKLRQLSNVVNGPLRLVLVEVLELTPLVIDWINVNTSGSAVCRYQANNIRKYEVRYQFGNLGNLVHELTHVGINESYGLDFINYPNWSALNVPERSLDAIGRCLNEAERQTKQMNHAMNDNKINILTRIKAWSDAATELTPEQKYEISNKLVYGMMNPQKESDTVLNQVLVWLFEWGFPMIGHHSKKPVVNALYEELSAVVKNAYLERQKGKIQHLMREII